MTAPRKPADHLPKAENPKVEKVDGAFHVTHKGVTVTVAIDALDDFELLDDIGAVEGGNAARLPSLLRRLIGEDYKPVLDAIRGDSGRVKIEDASAYIGNLLGAIAPN